MILKITSGRIMMRARRKNSITHSEKPTRNAFQDSRTKNKNECVSTDEVQKTDASPSPLESAHMRSDKKYVLPVRQ